MNALPYKLFTRSELRRIESHLTAVTKAWADTWVPHDELQTRVTVAPCERIPDSEHHWLSARANEVTWVAVLLDADRSLATLLMPTLSDSTRRPLDSGPMALALTASARRDLADHLLSSGNPVASAIRHEEWSSTSSWPVRVGSVGCGDVFAEIALNGWRVTAILSAEIARRLSMGKETRSPSRGALAPRRAALRPLRVRAEVRLGDAELSVRDLRRMSVGDVIRLNKKTQEPARVVVNGSDVCAGYLGSHRGRKAVLLKSITQ